MKLVQYIIVLSLLCLPYSVYAQADQAGFIAPIDPTAFPSDNVIYLPKEGVIFYDKPNGEYRGRISYGLPHNEQVPPGEKITQYATIQWRDIRPTLLDHSYFFKTYDQCLHIPFDKQEAGFVRIMTTPYEAWIPVESMKQWGFKLTYWIDFYGVRDRAITIPSGEKLPLLMSPYSDSEKITDLDDEHFTIKVIPFDNDEKTCCEGQFCYVEVIQYKENPCRNGDYSKRNAIQSYKGWLQIIDEKGINLVIHNSGGC